MLQWLNHRPAADCAPAAAAVIAAYTFNAFCSTASTYFGKICNAVVDLA